MNLKQFLKPNILKIALSILTYFSLSIFLLALPIYESPVSIVISKSICLQIFEEVIIILFSYLISCSLAVGIEKVTGKEMKGKSFFALDKRKITLAILLFISFPFFSLSSGEYFFQLIPFLLPLYWPLTILNFFEYFGQPFWMWMIDLFVLLSPLLLYLFACLIVWAWDKYFSQRNRFQKIFGVSFSLIIVTCGILLWNSIMVNPTGRSYDAIIKSNMDLIRSEAELYFENNWPNGYTGLNCDYGDSMIRICTAISNYVEKPIIWAAKDEYCAYTNLKVDKDNYYCVDRNGTAIETSINPGSSNYCDGITFVCP